MVIGDKLKLLLLAGGLFALAKYSETIVENTSPHIRMAMTIYNSYLDSRTRIGEFFLGKKGLKDGFIVSLDWTIRH